MRQIPADKNHLTAEVKGEIELEENVLVIRRIHVLYRIKSAADSQETIDRVHRVHANHCPVYRSLYKAIEITTEYRLEEAEGK